MSGIFTRDYGNTPSNPYTNFGNWGNPQAGGQVPVTSAPSAFNTSIQNTGIEATPGYGAGPSTGVKKDNGYSLGDWAQVGKGVADTYLGLESLQLGKDQFGFAKNSFNTNLANQAQLINNEMENRQRARLETSGQYTGAGGQASLQSDLQSYLKPRQVSGEAI